MNKYVYIYKQICIYIYICICTHMFIYTLICYVSVPATDFHLLSFLDRRAGKDAASAAWTRAHHERHRGAERGDLRGPDGLPGRVPVLGEMGS